MRAWPIFCCLGIAVASLFQSLPHWYWCLVFVGFIFLSIKVGQLQLMTAFFFGLVWGVSYGWLGLQARLPVALEKQDVWVEGTIESLPRKREKTVSFQFKVNCLWQGNMINKICDQSVRRIKLTSYDHKMEVHPGERWQLQVRLKRPHGFANPGGFDYEGYLFQHGIDGVGYVRDHFKNQLLEKTYLNLFDQIRFAIRDDLKSVLGDNEYVGFILALVIGDRQGITDDQWQVLTNTGTNHLLAISGLHVGLVSFLAYHLLRFFTRISLLSRLIPAPTVAAIAGLVAAFCYSALAGFSLPTQRALIMVSTVLIAQLLYRQINPFNAIAVALLLILMWDPLAVISPGFWLSFAAVFVLLFAFAGRYRPNGIWWQWGRAQWVVFIGLMPLLLIFFQQISLLSPIANIIAIPVVSFLIVPLSLLGVILFYISQALGVFCLNIASDLIVMLWQLLDYFYGLTKFIWIAPALTIWTLAGVIIGVLLLLLPRGIHGRWLGVIFFLPILFEQTEKLQNSELQFTVLDVGQGLGIVVQTANHVLVYDTGPYFSERFDAGKAVVLPFLRQQGIRSIDTLVISHGDQDHTGGLESVIKKIDIKTIVSGSTKNLSENLLIDYCQIGHQWEWDGVIFDIIYANHSSYAKENNRSCVLMIKTNHQAILLTGDIEHDVETQLVRQYGEELKADILIAPHHGSATSSSFVFINAVAPDHVIFSAGYLSRFGHPHPQVQQRYADRGVMMFNTAETGAITYNITEKNQIIVPELFRQKHRRYWFN